MALRDLATDSLAAVLFLGFKSCKCCHENSPHKRWHLRMMFFVLFKEFRLILLYLQVKKTFFF